MCKTWNHVQQADTCRCVRVRLDEEYAAWIEPDHGHVKGYSPFAAYTALHRHASKDLECLEWSISGYIYDNIDAPVSELQIVNHFTNLTHLSLYGVYLGTWPTESLFATPHLVKLHIGEGCLFIHPQGYKDKPDPSLAILNHHQKLRELSLDVYCTSQYLLPEVMPIEYVVSGDLHLPVLERLSLSSDEEGHIKLSDLSFHQVPLRCVVQLYGMELMHEEANNCYSWGDYIFRDYDEVS